MHYMSSTKSIVFKLLWIIKQDLSLMHVSFAEDLMVLRVLKFSHFNLGILAAFLAFSKHDTSGVLEKISF